MSTRPKSGHESTVSRALDHERGRGRTGLMSNGTAQADSQRCWVVPCAGSSCYSGLPPVFKAPQVLVKVGQDLLDLCLHVVFGREVECRVGVLLDASAEFLYHD